MPEASTSSAAATDLPSESKAVDPHATSSTLLAKEPASSKTQSLPSRSFQDFAHLLDVRVLRALAKLGFSHPTPVQSEVLPLALSGSDILARARTGSGKTLAYGLPILQKILLAKKSISRGDINYQVTRAIILVPTRELSEQVTSQIGALLPFLDKEVKIFNVARDASKKVHKILLAEKPDIVVSTPSRAFDHVQHERLDLAKVETLAVDEADLILSYGHDESLRALLSSANLSKSIQYLCMSATMTQDIQALKGLVLKRATVLDIPDPPMSTLTQFSVQVSSATDKFLLTYVILRLRLIRGKCIIFVNDIDRCYRLKLFLEQFGVRSTVLNEELPVNSRYHIVQEFNKGVYDYIIATDESQFGADAAVEAKEPKESKGEGKGKKKASEYGVSRGIDFVSVSCVLNFDLPVSVKGYTHRVGRTARAGKTGTSLSYVVPKEVYEQDMRTGGGDRHLICKTTEKDEEVWAKIVQQETSKGQEVKEWKFDRAQIEAFRYRMEDGLRSVTKASIREARIREIKAELLNSERLKAHFEDNPTDLEYLRHDKVLHPTRVQAHLKHIPGYLMPRIRGTKTTQIAEGDGGDGKASEVNGSNKRERTNDDDGVGFVSFGSKKHHNSGRGERGGRGGRGRGRGRGGMTRGGGPTKKRNDPLRKFGK